MKVEREAEASKGKSASSQEGMASGLSDMTLRAFPPMTFVKLEYSAHSSCSFMLKHEKRRGRGGGKGNSSSERSFLKLKLA